MWSEMSYNRYRYSSQHERIRREYETDWSIDKDESVVEEEEIDEKI